jgi:hypothetical protein
MVLNKHIMPLCDRQFSKNKISVALGAGLNPDTNASSKNASFNIECHFHPVSV